MHIKKTLSIAAGLRVAALCVAFGAAADAAQAEVHIGVTLSTTGPGASLGIPAEQALKMWPAEIAG